MDLQKGTLVFTNSVKHPLLAKDKELPEEERHIFAKCVVVGEDGAQTKLKDSVSGIIFSAPTANIFERNLENQDVLSFTDIGQLVHQNAGCVLEFLSERLKKGEIYTNADPLLVAINPYKDLKNATDSTIMKYKNASDTRHLSPHVFSVARRAVESLLSAKISQTIMVSGESGAGKTEATKHIMRYCAMGSSESAIQRAIMAANPVLEAFGNAMTIRNNNSSRFGRYMQLEVKEGGGFRHGTVRNFLLEKSRVVNQGDNERTYHVFYQLLKAAPDSILKDLGLNRNIKNYKTFTSTVTEAEGINDKDDFKLVVESLKGMMFSESDIVAVWSVLAGILHLGNVEVTAGANDSSSLRASEVEPVSKCLGIKTQTLIDAMTKKRNVIAGNEVVSNFNQKDASVLRDSFAKSLYDELFKFIIHQLNKNIAPPNGNYKYYLGLLDIFGFEVFKTNSIEQLFINITNERLQKNFIDVVFDRETKLYKEEGIANPNVIWKDNNAVIELLSGPRNSVLAILEDSCLAPGASDSNFLGNLKSGLSSNPSFVTTKIGGNTDFTIQHTIGALQYYTPGFIKKNTDILRGELVEICQFSSMKIMRDMYRDKDVVKGKLGKGQLIGSQFNRDLNSLMDLINQHECHFVRCVKPNELKKPLHPCNGKIMQQLTSLSIMDALQLAQLGYSYRRPYGDFVNQFRFANLGITDGSSKDVDKMISLIRYCKVPEKDWKVGKTMIFMTTDGVKIMNQITRNSLMKWRPLLGVIEACIQKRQLASIQRKMNPLLCRIQKAARAKLAHVRAQAA